MGILRVYLALCVVAAHSNAVFPWRMHDGTEAVQIFYVISGFYMAMVLSGRYTEPRKFYLSRAIRIFPPYWVVLAATLVLSTLGGLFFHQWLVLAPYVNHPFEHNGVAGVLLTTLANFSLIGQDWVMFVSHNAGQALRFTENFRYDDFPLRQYLLVPQCWSIGLELTFYAVAPFLNRLRSRWLVCMALGAMVLRLNAYTLLDLGNDPWTYRFFPFEISQFLFGMLGYRLYTRTAAYHPSQRFRCTSTFSYLAGGIVLLGALYVHAQMTNYVGEMVNPLWGKFVTYPFWVLGVPILFFVFGNQKADRTFGELSYPIYLVHFLVVFIVAIVLDKVGLKLQIGIVSALTSLLLSVIFYRWLIAPLDRKRHSLTISRADQPQRLATR